MARTKQSRGKCAFCGREMTKGGLSRHLKTCSEREEAIRGANQGPGEELVLCHVQVQDARRADFWLHLELPGSATLKDLDSYLRAIWFEGSELLSQFSIGDWSRGQISKAKRAVQVFEPGLVLTHTYDFGISSGKLTKFRSSSETLIKVVGVREGKRLTSHPIFLMARNVRPQVYCGECGQPASWFCYGCVWELEEPGTLCDRHAQGHTTHPYSEPVALVNSPREWPHLDG